MLTQWVPFPSVIHTYAIHRLKYLQLFELGHWDHHILHVSKAWLSASQQHQAKHQAAAEAQGGLGHAILLQARCSWQLSACGLVGGLRGSRSSGALGDKDQVHGGHSQAACQEQRTVAGHDSKTRSKPHRLENKVGPAEPKKITMPWRSTSRMHN